MGDPIDSSKDFKMFIDIIKSNGVAADVNEQQLKACKKFPELVKKSMDEPIDFDGRKGVFTLILVVHL